jgi:hypothetical protein
VRVINRKCSTRVVPNTDKVDTVPLSSASSLGVGYTETRSEQIMVCSYIVKDIQEATATNEGDFYGNVKHWIMGSKQQQSFT